MFGRVSGNEGASTLVLYIIPKEYEQKCLFSTVAEVPEVAPIFVPVEAFCLWLAPLLVRAQTEINNEGIRPD